MQGRIEQHLKRNLIKKDIREYFMIRLAKTKDNS